MRCVVCEGGVDSGGVGVLFDCVVTTEKEKDVVGCIYGDEDVGGRGVESNPGMLRVTVSRDRAMRRRLAGGLVFLRMTVSMNAVMGS